MKKLLAAGVLGVLAAGLALAMLATADDGKGEIRSGGDGPLTFAVYGDSPYSNVAANYNATPPDDPTQFNATPAFIDAINADPKVKLVLHVGDIHSGKQYCTVAYDRRSPTCGRRSRIRSSTRPATTSGPTATRPGGGRRTCNRTPSRQLRSTTPTAIRSRTSTSCARSSSRSPARRSAAAQEVLSQAQAFDPAHPTDAEYVENVMWEQSGVLFVTINLPGGSNNDTDGWYGAAATGEQRHRRSLSGQAPTSAGSTPRSRARGATAPRAS